MHETLRKMRQKREGGDSGFTLIELLVVVVIIGVLVAIAIPLYLNYRKGAANKSAASDVRGAMSAIEQFYTENNNTYPDAIPAPAAGVGAGVSIVLKLATVATSQSITLSPGNTLAFSKSASSTYKVCAVNADGGVYYRYNSAVGGSVTKFVTTSLDLCVAAP